MAPAGYFWTSLPVSLIPAHTYLAFQTVEFSPTQAPLCVASLCITSPVHAAARGPAQHAPGLKRVHFRKIISVVVLFFPSRKNPFSRLELFCGEHQVPCGGVWSSSNLKGVIQTSHCLDLSVYMGRKRIYHGLLCGPNYTGDGQQCVLQKGSAWCQYGDFGDLDLCESSLCSPHGFKCRSILPREETAGPTNSSLI